MASLKGKEEITSQYSSSLTEKEKGANHFLHLEEVSNLF